MKTLPHYFNTPSKNIDAEFHLQAVKQDFKKKKITKVIHLTTKIHAYCIMHLETLIKFYFAGMRGREVHPNPIALGKKV